VSDLPSVPPGDFEPLVTIPVLARRMGQPRSSVFRRLLQLHAADRARGPEHGRWLVRYAPGVRGPWRVNVGLLQREHPELRRTRTPQEVDDRLEEIAEKISEVEGHGLHTRKLVTALTEGFKSHKRFAHGGSAA